MRVGTGFLEVLPDFSKFGAAAAAQSGGLQAGMASLGSSMTKSLTLPMAAAAAAGAVMFTGFESSMTKIESLVGASRQEVEAYAAAVGDLSKSVGKGPRELADALFFITSAGLEGEQALRALEAAAKGSAIGLGETAVVADALTSAMNAYGAENLSAEQATAILVATVREGKVEADQLAGSLGKVIPIASEMGVEFDEVGAAIAAMTRLGLDANVATTGLRALFSGLLQDSPKVRKGLESVGLSLEGMQASLRDDGLLVTLQTLNDRFGDNTTALAEVFPNVRALTSVLALVGNNADQAEEIFQSLADTTVNDLNDSFEVAAATAEFKFGQAMANLQTSLVDIGAVVVPILVKIAGGVAAVATAFSGLPEGVQKTVITFGLMVAAIGPLLSLGGKLVGMAKGIGAAYTLAQVVILEFTGSMALASAAIPIVGIALVAGLAAWRVWGAAARQAAEDSEAFAKVVSELAGNVDAAREQFVFDELVKDDDLKTLNALGLTVADFIALMEEGNPGFQKFSDIMAETTGRATDHSKSLIVNEALYQAWREETGLTSRDLQDLRRKFDENTRSYQAYNEQVAIATEAQRALNEQNAIDAGYDGVEEQYNDEAMALAYLTTKKNEAAEAAAGIVIATEEEAEAAAVATEAWNAYTQGVSDLAAKREQDLDASVSKIIDLFADDLPEALDTSTQKMLENSEEQAALAVRFREAITMLSEAGAHSLVAELEAQGPIATEQAETLAQDLETAFEIEDNLRTAMGDSLAGITGPLEDPAMTALMFDIGAEYGTHVVRGFNSTAVLALGGVPVRQTADYNTYKDRGRAEGGRFSEGLFTVGERGPEIAGFDRPGAVLNSQDLAKAIANGLSGRDGGNVSFAMEINNPTGEPSETSMQNALAAATTVLATTRVFPT